MWPWAEKPTTYPDTHEEPNRPIRDPKAADFLRTYRDEEVAAGRFSPAFGDTLLPGMYSSPIGVIPKPHSDKFRMINDHSAGKYSLNSMIPRDQVHITLDGMKVFGRHILSLRRKFPDRELVVFKSDVSRAFRNMPCSPEWQAMQALQIDGQFHIDRSCEFGTSSSPRAFTEPYSLVLWGAEQDGIDGIACWMDDTSGVEVKGKMLHYEPYQQEYPEKQTRYLLHLDHYQYPHEKSKQLYGPVLTVIGFEVDPNAMTVTLPTEARDKLVSRVHEFLSTRRQTLVEFRRLGGYLNWVLNVYPLLKPALRPLYDKLKGKHSQYASMYLNNSIRRALAWFLARVATLPGVLLLQSISWSVFDADLVVYCDASGSGLGFWCPTLAVAAYSELPPLCSTDSPEPATIFYREAYTVLCGLRWASNQDPKPHKIGLLTDNSNTVNIFSSLSAQQRYNHLLVRACELAMVKGLEFRVAHLPGDKNPVADALSRGWLVKVKKMIPQAKLFHFITPTTWLGDEWI